MYDCFYFDILNAAWKNEINDLCVLQVVIGGPSLSLCVCTPPCLLILKVKKINNNSMSNEIII